MGLGAPGDMNKFYWHRNTSLNKTRWVDGTLTLYITLEMIGFIQLISDASHSIHRFVLCCIQVMAKIKIEGCINFDAWRSINMFIFCFMAIGSFILNIAKWIFYYQNSRSRSKLMAIFKAWHSICMFIFYSNSMSTFEAWHTMGTFTFCLAIRPFSKLNIWPRKFIANVTTKI